MALLYPWATKEYLLWKMSLGQIIMYFNLGTEAKKPEPENKGKAADMSHSQLKAIRDELRQLGLSESKESKEKEAEVKDELRKKYGDIG